MLALGLMYGTPAQAEPITLPDPAVLAAMPDPTSLTFYFHYKFEDVGPPAWTDVSPRESGVPGLPPQAGVNIPDFVAGPGGPPVIRTPDDTPSAAVPEPATLLLLGMGVAGLALRSRQR